MSGNIRALIVVCPFQLGLSISGSVRFWTKINNQTKFFKKKIVNRTEPKTGSNWLISVQFGFFPSQTGSNPMVLYTSPATSYSRSQVARGEDPFRLRRLNPCLQLHIMLMETIQTKPNLANQAKNPRPEH